MVTVKASFVPHTHDYSFTANGMELTAECKNTDGAHVGSIKAALTLIPPEAPIYDGTTKTASVSGTIPDIVTPAIVYRQDGTDLGGAPVNAGTYTAEITLGGATASAGFTIAAKAVTVTADDKSKKPGEPDPDLTATVEGTIGSDTVTYTLRRAEGEEPGTYAVTVAGEVSQGNYSVSFVNGTFTISPKELRTEQPPLTEVPEGLKEIGISSVSEIEQNLLLKLEVNGEPAEIEQTVFIDVVLEVSFDGGTTWEIATPDNFPKGGMEVRLDYPEGTGKDTHEFSVSHMFTVGEKAGQVEYPDVTARDDGLFVWLTGLSLVAIAWRETNTPGPERPGIDFFRLHGDCELPVTGFSALRPTVLPEQPKDLRYEPVRMHLMLPMQDRDIELVTMPWKGNSWAAAWLGSDAGILEGSALPGEGVSVIAGHNTLNDTDYGPFALLAALDIGDVLFVRRSDGELLRFTVYANEKIGAGDADALQKSALAYENTLTLLTCEDELPEGGYASRRIVSAKYIN